MYRCIAKLEIDLEGLSEFYSDVSEYETLNMDLILKKRCSVYQNML